MRLIILENVKIAVVDDDQMSRDLLSTTFMYCVNRGVLTFENGSEAWSHLKGSGNIDIIVSDVDMPKMNGFELLAKIRKKYPGKICIMMSQNSSNEKSAMALGANAFLAKPFNINDLFNIVETFVVEGHVNEPL